MTATSGRTLEYQTMIFFPEKDARFSKFKNMFVNLASFMGNPVSADCSRSFIFLWGTGLIRFLDLTAYKNHLMLNLINKLSNFPF